MTLLRKISICVQKGTVRNMRYRLQEAQKALYRDPNVFHFQGDEYEHVHLQ